MLFRIFFYPYQLLLYSLASIKHGAWCSVHNLKFLYSLYANNVVVFVVLKKIFSRWMMLMKLLPKKIALFGGLL